MTMGECQISEDMNPATKCIPILVNLVMFFRGLPLGEIEDTCVVKNQQLGGSSSSRFSCLSSMVMAVLSSVSSSIDINNNVYTVCLYIFCLYM